MYTTKIVVACLLMTVSIANSAVTNNKDSIGFPEAEENTNLKNKENRVPVYMPSKCPINELYYPGDQKDDWICDCRPAHIYHPATDTCWPAYRQGPCKKEQYLVLPLNSVVPVCEENTCVIDGYVPWNGKCARLGAVSPCEHIIPISAVGVNATTLAISCVRLNLESRFGDDAPAPPPVENVTCPPGCRRSINGKCVPITF